jgi:hypothetical protein
MFSMDYEFEHCPITIFSVESLPKLTSFRKIPWVHQETRGRKRDLSGYAARDSIIQGPAVLICAVVLQHTLTKGPAKAKECGSEELCGRSALRNEAIKIRPQQRSRFCQKRSNGNDQGGIWQIQHLEG